MSLLRKVEVSQNSDVVDLAGRVVTSQPFTLFQSKHIDGKQPLLWDEVTNGTGASVHNSGDSDISMSVTTSGDYVIRETFQRFAYQPYKVQDIALTGVPLNPVANLTTKMGYFNTSTTGPYTANCDGIYIGTDGTNKFVAVCKDGTENKVIQSAWNLDTLDGNGPSGKTFDWDEEQFIRINFLWLGVDVVLFSTKIDNELIPFHYIAHENGDASGMGAYMKSANHSLRYEIRSTGGSGTMRVTCGAVNSLGGSDPAGIPRAIDNGITAITCGTADEGILFYRVNSSRPDTLIDIDSFSVLNSSNNANNYRWSIILNPTIGGTAPTYSTLSNSGIDYAVGAGDNTLTNGTILKSGYAAGDVPSLALPADLLIRPGISIAGTQDVIALAVQTFTGTDSFVGSFNLKEITSG